MGFSCAPIEQGSCQENGLFCSFSHNIQNLKLLPVGCLTSHLPQNRLLYFNLGAVVKADDNVEKTEDEEKGKCLLEKKLWQGMLKRN